MNKDLSLKEIMQLGDMMRGCMSIINNMEERELKELNEKSMKCPQCGTLTFIDVDLFHNNKKNSLFRCTCQNCGYDAPVHIKNGEWEEWK